MRRRYGRQRPAAPRIEVPESGPAPRAPADMPTADARSTWPSSTPPGRCSRHDRVTAAGRVRPADPSTWTSPGRPGGNGPGTARWVHRPTGRSRSGQRRAQITLLALPADRAAPLLIPVVVLAD